MKTEIYPSIAAFRERSDKTWNGVSQEFAEANPDYAKDNESNEACWNCSRCSHCSDCSHCSRCSRCSDCSDCYDCSGCSDCSRCSDCSDCYDCSRCSRCSDCSDCYDCSDCSRCSRCSGVKDSRPVQAPAGKSWLNVPVVPNIHQSILRAASQPDALDMSDFHSCSTTHCRAGWAVHLAGEAGYALEKATSSVFAAMQIIKASSPIKVSPVRFFDSNEVAMADMKRCAEEEAKTTR